VCALNDLVGPNEKAAHLANRETRALSPIRAPVRRVPLAFAGRVARGPRGRAGRRGCRRRAEHAAAVPALPHAQNGARELGSTEGASRGGSRAGSHRLRRDKKSSSEPMSPLPTQSSTQTRASKRRLVLNAFFVSFLLFSFLIRAENSKPQNATRTR
jgi:hypothetical protein